MYNEVERHYNKHIDNNDDYLRLDHDGEESEEDDGVTTKREGVFDLGIGSDDDDDDGNMSSDDSEEEIDNEAAIHIPVDEDDSTDNSEDEEETNVFNWGTKKHSYYHGDTADLEIGQDEDDALLEEEAGKEVQMARLEGVEEGDFMLGDEDAKEEKKTVKHRVKRKEKNFSRKDKLKVMKKAHPELMPVVDHFKGGLEDFVNTTAVVGDALFRADGGNESEAVGSTPAGLQYLITKSMLQASKALNLSLYLLLKADQASPISDAPAPILENNDNLFLVDDDANDIQNHPVMDRLNQLSQLTDKLKENVEDKTPGLEQQMHSLVKAAALMKGQSVESSDESSVEDEDDTEKGTEVSTDKSNVRTTSTQEDSDASSEASSDSDEEESEAVIQRRILTEAKFALRNQDIDDAVKSSKSRIRRLAPPSSMDYGDDAEEVSEKALEAGRKLASTMNSITQKSASNKGKKNQLINVEDEVDEYDQLQRGLAMMDDEFGVGSDAEDGGGSEAEDEGFGDEDGDDFYNKIKSKSLAKKEAKKQMYAVAPKYPRLDDEIEGERAISRVILKNRGLVPHKPKINRNPRVKKREQYRKALIRRKGAVREMRTEESHVYGGESTGIKAGISRSRKLGGGR